MMKIQRTKTTSLNEAGGRRCDKTKIGGYEKRSVREMEGELLK